MSQGKKMTFEEAYHAAEKHMETVDLTKFQHPTPPQPAAAAQGVAAGHPSTDVHAQVSLAQTCGSYAMVRPIIYMVSFMPFFPAKWRDALTVFMRGMDAVCPMPTPQ